MLVMILFVKVFDKWIFSINIENEFTTINQVKRENDELY